MKLVTAITTAAVLSLSVVSAANAGNTLEPIDDDVLIIPAAVPAAVAGSSSLSPLVILGAVAGVALVAGVVASQNSSSGTN